MTNAEVGIVGGGVHGASAAYHLAQRGVSTVLFERGAAAGGPTGRSSAVCRAYYTDPFLARVARESLDMFADFAAHTGGRDAGFRRTSALFLHGDDDVEEVTRTAAALRAIGTGVDVLDPPAVRERYPRLDVAGLGCAAVEHGAGYADPVDTTVGLLSRARELGAHVRLNTEVTGLTSIGRAGTIVHLADGEEVAVTRLLLAAGPWTGRLARMLEVELPLTVERHVVATCAWGDAEPVPFAFADVPGGYYARPELDDTFLLGPLTAEPPIEDPDRFDERIHDDEVERLVAAAVRRIPSLDGLQPRGGWASLYDVSPDWQPVIGTVAPCVVVDAGTSGHGFKLAPALGRYVADLVLGEPDPELRRFDPVRFEDGEGLHAGYGEARILG
jgi:sarcosine oxidase, subunit beta